ncbi:cadmium-induced protein AS8 isoform X3 [Rhodamnia argentea]|uniref:Cadmium-induced protein AS8 isoform X3 n=1 Tax=Rhodamnia argentea TaxID=178133 RepID=A0ABM3HYP8_9MYRT|nr:cadmium-induced protein AS8 isoform X3 [Rhodamnia argentea]
MFCNVGMIIKGLLRRYERWNPVHPTFGAFSGMGFGLGCGVGWGPGFGPEVIGYVGAGCGVGFSVGFTVAGFGIGLPANYLFEVPHNVTAVRSTASEFGQFGGLISRKSIAGGGWNIAPHISVFHTEADRKLSSFRRKHFLQPTSNLFDLNFPLQSGDVWKCLGAFGSRLVHPRKADVGKQG